MAAVILQHRLNALGQLFIFFFKESSGIVYQASWSIFKAFFLDAGCFFGVLWSHTASKMLWCSLWGAQSMTGCVLLCIFLHNFTHFLCNHVLDSHLSNDSISDEAWQINWRSRCICILYQVFAAFLFLRDKMFSCCRHLFHFFQILPKEHTAHYAELIHFNSISFSQLYR